MNKGIALKIGIAWKKAMGDDSEYEEKNDVLDMLLKPPTPGTIQESMAYWEYLD